MRVTSNSYSEALIKRLEVLTQRQGALQTQIATGQRIQNAGEDPLAAQRILNLRDESVATEQYQKNILTHQDFARTTHVALRGLQKVVDRVQEIALRADDLDSPDDLKIFGKEVSELLKEAVHIANTQFRGDYIFSGTKTSVAAVNATHDNDGRVTAVEFGGNTSQAASEIAPGVLTSSRVPAENRSGSGEVGLFADSRSGADLFAHLITLQDQLSSGDTAGIRETADDLKSDEANLLYHVAGNGALQSRLESMLNSHKDQELVIDGDLSKTGDADISEVIVRLTQQQTAYQATLQSAASVMNLSLLSFLR